jgi:hypothetical protein
MKAQKGKIYKSVEIRGNWCHWGLWCSQIHIFLYSVLGTVWCSHIQMVVMFKPLELCSMSYSHPSFRRTMHNRMYSFKIGWFCLGWSVVIWAAIIWYSACPVNTLNGWITACYSVDIMRPGTSWSRWCLLIMMQFFRMTMCLFTQPEMFGLGLRSMKIHLNICVQHTCQT